MKDVYEVVLVERATGRVRHHYKGPWPAVAADRLRRRVEAHVDADRFDVCVQRPAQSWPAEEEAAELPADDGVLDGIQL